MMHSGLSLSLKYVARRGGKSSSGVANKMFKIQRLALTTDLWTDVTNKGFMSLTVHFITKECEITSFNLDGRRWPAVVRRVVSSQMVWKSCSRVEGIATDSNHINILAAADSTAIVTPLLVSLRPILSNLCYRLRPRPTPRPRWPKLLVSLRPLWA